MGTGQKFVKFAGIMFLCLGTLATASGETSKGQRKPKKPQLPPLPSGPTGRPVPQIPLDSIAAVAPQVSYQHGQLTIISPNSTLGDILRAIKKQTGADIDVPAANERVVTRLGPGPARDVIAELLNGSRFNYVLLGSAEDANLLTRVVLVPKTTGGETAVANNNPGQQPMGQPMMQPASMPPAPVEMATQDEPDANGEENAQDDANADQSAADAEQPQQPVDPSQGQPEIKTPQQMLQEMQQRQLQMQQQQQPGQPPVPGSGMPPHPPQQRSEER